MTMSAVACVHYWDIDPSNGHTSKGICRICGEIKDFLNSVPEEEKFKFVLAQHPRKREEVEMAKNQGGDMRDRATELTTARHEAERLYREGKAPLEVAALLRREFGDIALSTVTGWKYRMAPETHKAETTKEPTPPADETLWQMVMDARPDWTDKPRLGHWMDMVDAVYAFLVEL